MRITKNQLKQIIKEELGRVLAESPPPQEIEMDPVRITGTPGIGRDIEQPMNPDAITGQDFFEEYGESRESMGPGFAAGYRRAFLGLARSQEDFDRQEDWVKKRFAESPGLPQEFLDDQLADIARERGMLADPADPENPLHVPQTPGGSSVESRRMRDQVYSRNLPENRRRKIRKVRKTRRK